MISKDALELIQNAIRIYDKLVDRTYLLAYRGSVKQELKLIEIQIRKRNFWHLVGCKVLNDGEVIYDRCLLGEDVSGDISYTRRKEDVRVKTTVFCQIFDFVSNAKILTIAGTSKSPEQFMFTIGAGNTKGLIGYAKINKEYIPKTTQDKSVFMLDPTANGKINLILSKSAEANMYEKVEYTISKKYEKQLLKEVSEHIDLDEKITDLIKLDSEKIISNSTEENK